MRAPVLRPHPALVATLVATLAASTAALGSCKKQGAERVEGEAITTPMRDDFERGELGDNYFATTDNYGLVNGAISAKGAHNHPLWLTRKLPEKVAIEFDCWSNSSDGDIKVEFYGDGQSHAATKKKVAYKATGYVAVMGGWNNSKSLLAHQDEHGTPGVDLVERRAPKVELGKRYHWKLVRDGAQITWYVDDMSTPFLEFRDPNPIGDERHAYFAFNNWESDTWFDNLVITPL